MSRSPAEKPRFNFTLRESLIAMVAVAALLALAVKSYENSQPFVPTAVFESLDTEKAKSIVAATGQQLDVEISQNGAGAGESTGGNSANREIRLNVGVPSDAHSKIVSGLRAEIEKMLDDAGCTIVSSGGASEGSKQDITQFSFDYENENTRGHLLVHRVPASADDLNLFILIHEFRQ